METNTSTPPSRQNISFRMYREMLPKEEDVVMVCFSEITDSAVYGTLPEYNHHQGMMTLSEVSRKRIKLVSTVLTVGKTEPCVVVRVDAEKGYIDLSRRRVRMEDVTECQTRYQKSYKVHNMFRRLAETSETPIATLYERIAWPLTETHGHVYDGLLASLANPSLLDRLSLTDTLQEQLSSLVRQRMTSGPMRQRARISIECYNRAGIDAIKDAIGAGLSAGRHPSDGSHGVAVWLIASPIYEVSVATMDTKEGKELLENAIASIEREIKRQGGDFAIKLPIELVSKDDKGKETLLNESATKATASKTSDSPDEQEEDNEEGIEYELEE